MPFEADFDHQRNPSRLLEWFGARRVDDIEVGDPLFDDAVKIRGDHPALVRWLSDEGVQTAIMNVVTGRLSGRVKVSRTGLDVIVASEGVENSARLESLATALAVSLLRSTDGETNREEDVGALVASSGGALVAGELDTDHFGPIAISRTGSTLVIRENMRKRLKTEALLTIVAFPILAFIGFAAPGKSVLPVSVAAAVAGAFSVLGLLWTTFRFFTLPRERTVELRAGRALEVIENDEVVAVLEWEDNPHIATPQGGGLVLGAPGFSLSLAQSALITPMGMQPTVVNFLRDARPEDAPKALVDETTT